MGALSQAWCPTSRRIVNSGKRAHLEPLPAAECGVTLPGGSAPTPRGHREQGSSSPAAPCAAGGKSAPTESRTSNAASPLPPPTRGTAAPSPEASASPQPTVRRQRRRPAGRAGHRRRCRIRGRYRRTGEAGPGPAAARESEHGAAPTSVPTSGSSTPACRWPRSRPPSTPFTPNRSTTKWAPSGTPCCSSPAPTAAPRSPSSSRWATRRRSPASALRPRMSPSTGTWTSTTGA